MTFLGETKMNRMLFKVITIAILVLSSVSLGYSGGSGEPNDPYQIATKADLLELAGTIEDYNKCFILTANINMTGQVFTMAPIAPDTNTASDFQGTGFSGVFDGNNHKVTNFTINSATNNYIGLFGRTDPCSTLKNLAVEDFNINGLPDSRFVGALTGRNLGTITNCWSIGSVIGDYLVGGLTGCNDGLYGNGTITDCWFAGIVNGRCAGGLVGCNFQDAVMTGCYSITDVNGLESIGGLIGYNEYGIVAKCWSTGAISGVSRVGGLIGYNKNHTDNGISDCNSTSTVTGYGEVGGLVGENHTSGNITNCYSTGAVNGTVTSLHIGGLTGTNSGSIKNSCSKGTVSASSNSERVGGLVGYNAAGSITDCHSAGNVDVASGSAYVGGLVGYNSSTISESYSTGNINASSYVGGLVGYNQNIIMNSYSAGSVTGTDHVGGLIGRIWYGNTTNCYSIGAVTGTSDTGAMVGSKFEGSITSSYFLTGSGPDNGFGLSLTDAQMKQQASFIDWDFIEIWNIGENQTYPFLRTYLPSDINKDNETNFYDLAILASHWLQQE